MKLFEFSTGRLSSRPTADIPVVSSEDALSSELVERLRSAPEVLIRFGALKDGRGFSWSRLLKRRFRFCGQLYAIGPLIPDQAAFLARSGFDGVFIEDEVQLAAWKACLHHYHRYHQPDPVIQLEL